MPKRVLRFMFLVLRHRLANLIIDRSIPLKGRSRNRKPIPSRVVQKSFLDMLDVMTILESPDFAMSSSTEVALIEMTALAEGDF